MLKLAGSNSGNTVTGAITNGSSGGTVTVTSAAGTQSWTLLGQNTYSGPTNVNGGTLIFGGAGTLSASTAFNLNSGTAEVLNDNGGSSGGTVTYPNSVNLTGTGGGTATVSTLRVGNNGNVNTPTTCRLRRAEQHDRE